jgi:hypothetical protein
MIAAREHQVRCAEIAPQRVYRLLKYVPRARGRAVRPQVYEYLVSRQAILASHRKQREQSERAALYGRPVQ